MKNKKFKKEFFYPLKEFHKRRTESFANATGFLDSFFHYILAILSLLSIHHLFQSIFPKKRFWVTDFYCTAWFLFGLGTFICIWNNYSFCLEQNSPNLILVFVIYRLVESILREIWILLYRNKELSSASRLLVISWLNYVTAIFLFGLVYEQGIIGYKKSFLIGLSFSPSNFENFTFIELGQSVYCIIFITLLVSVFVSKISTSN